MSASRVEKVTFKTELLIDEGFVRDMNNAFNVLNVRIQIVAIGTQHVSVERKPAEEPKQSRKTLKRKSLDANDTLA